MRRVCSLMKTYLCQCKGWNGSRGVGFHLLSGKKLSYGLNHLKKLLPKIDRYLWKPYHYLQMSDKTVLVHLYVPAQACERSQYKISNTFREKIPKGCLKITIRSYLRQLFSSHLKKLHKKKKKEGTIKRLIQCILIPYLFNSGNVKLFHINIFFKS